MQELPKTPNIYDLKLWKRFWEISRLYWNSEEKRRARGVLALLLLLMAGSALIAVKISYISSDFLTALSKMDRQGFNHGLLLYLVAYAVSTPTEVYKTYIENSLRVNWRLWLTNHFLEKYLANRAYYHINDLLDVDNPDQRISENIADFTRSSLGYISTIFQNLILFCSFAGVLWSVSIKLVLVLLLYAAIGTLVTIVLGRPLLHLNFQVQQKSADFRYGLVHIRDHAESIAFFRGEGREAQQIMQRLQKLISNKLTLIGQERNLGFFTSIFKALPGILPFVVLAPDYFSGKIEFGILALGANAFSRVLSSITIIVEMFNSLSNFAAKITRVESFAAALTPPVQENTVGGLPTIGSQEGSRLALKGVTLQTPDYRRTLIRNVTAEVLPGTGMLIAGASGAGKSSILRAIAGLWNTGEGEISRPPLHEMLFLPQRPYMIHGTLREQLHYPNLDRDVSDEELGALLEKVKLDGLHNRFGGFDAVMDWGHLLSLGEQQRLAFARLLITGPRYAILDEATSALDVTNEARLYRQLQESAMTFVSVGHRPSLLAYHDNVLELQGNATWRLVPAGEFQITVGSL